MDMLSLAVVAAAACHYEVAMKTLSVNAAVAAGEPTCLLGGPVPVRLTITNTSAIPVLAELPYPNPDGLSVRLLGGAAVGLPALPPTRFQATVTTPLDPGQSASQTHFLNRYLRFTAAGPVRIGWALSIYVRAQDRTAGPGETLTFSGEITIQLAGADDPKLSKELARYAAHLDSPDAQTRLEVAEALAFLDTPAAVDAQSQLLAVPGTAQVGVRALGRHQRQDANERVLQALNHPEAAVVIEALAVIDRNRIPVERSRIRAMLASPNESVRWAALTWLARSPDRADLSSVQGLLQDPNERLREKAREYLSVLQAAP